jgi:hypothetical protein
MHAPNPKFKKKLIYPYLFRPRASSAKKTGSVRNRPVQAKKTGSVQNRFRQKKNRFLVQNRPIPYGTGQKRFDESNRTGRGSEPVGPAGFTGSGSVLVTLGRPAGALKVGWCQ